MPRAGRSNSAVGGLTGAARSAADSPWVARLARLGLAARALVYLLIGWLALQVALGRSRTEIDQRGALATVAHASYGRVLLWVVAVGFAGYALWRFTEAAFGATGEGRKAGPRLQSLVRGLVYAGLCATTVSLLLGTSRQSQGQQSSTLTARVLAQPFGRVLVGAVGLALVAVGAAMVWEGVTRAFEKHLRLAEMSPGTRTAVQRLGMVGTVARGLVFMLTGALVVAAAVTFDPQKARGLDGALKTLAAQAYGPVLLGAVALGLVAFGLYGFAEARYRRT